MPNEHIDGMIMPIMQMTDIIIMDEHDREYSDKCWK